MEKSGLQAYVATAGANGALMLFGREVRNYRDWLAIEIELMAALLVCHSQSRGNATAIRLGRTVDDIVATQDADIDRHLAAFAEVATSLAQAQHELWGEA